VVRECLSKSPIVGVGQTFVTKFGNVRLIQLYDSGSGMIGIKPNGWSEVMYSTVDWRVEDIGPMTVMTNFFTLAGGGCNFYVCGPDVPAVTPTPTPTPKPTPTPTPAPVGTVNVSLDISSHGKVEFDSILYWQEGMTKWEYVSKTIPNKET